MERLGKTHSGPTWSLAAACALGVLAACGGGSDGGSNGPPTGPGSNVTSITINLRDVVLAGISVVATANATLSNGQTQAVTSGWRSDAPAVATITDGGTLNPLANGEATITVTSGGAQASKRIRVAPNYDGRWQGLQVVTACNATGDFVGICEAGGNIIGLSFPVGLTARHPGDLTVSGEFTIEDLPFPTFTTQIESDGRLRFASTTVVEGIRAEASWEVNASEPGRATGTIREQYSAPGLISGDVTYDSNLSGFTRSTSAADAPRRGTRFERLRLRTAAAGR